MNLSYTINTELFTIFHVAKATTNFGLLLSKDDFSSYFDLLGDDGFGSSDINVQTTGDGVFAQLFGSADSDFAIWSTVRTATNHINIYHNGDSVLNKTQVDWSGNWASNRLQGNGAICFDVKLKELIIYNSTLSDANRLLVEAYLKGRYTL
jgi:hypothetical protein